MNNKTVVVTGGNGLLGKELSTYLYGLDFSVIVIDIDGGFVLESFFGNENDPSDAQKSGLL